MLSKLKHADDQSNPCLQRTLLYRPKSIYRRKYDTGQAKYRKSSKSRKYFSGKIV